MSQTGEGGVRSGISNEYGGYQFKKNFMDFAVPQANYLAEYGKWTNLFKSLFVKRGATK